MTGFGQHLLGERFETKHACPECPIPGTIGLDKLLVAPSLVCRWCDGTALVTTEQLARWQAHMDRLDRLS